MIVVTCYYVITSTCILFKFRFYSKVVITEEGLRPKRFIKFLTFFNVRSCPSSLLLNSYIYMKRLIEMTEKLINRMRWRAYHFLNPSSESEHRETYGFNSKKTPPQVPELSEFEAKMTNLIQNIEFKEPRPTEFQKELSEHVESMNKDNNLYVPADKTTNFYKMNVSDYNTLLKKNIEKEYRKAPDNADMQINTEAKAFAQTLKIDDRVEKLAPKESFITLKDHKDNFLNNPTCRLINPTKSELGKVSKQILDKINRTIIHKTHVHQWKNTRATLD